MGNTYQLIRRNDDGTETMIAEAEGSPFWEDMYELAKLTFGDDNVYYTFGVQGRTHTVPARQVSGAVDYAERIPGVVEWLTEIVDRFVESPENALTGDRNVDEQVEAYRVRCEAFAAEQTLLALYAEVPATELVQRVWDVFKVLVVMEVGYGETETWRSGVAFEAYRRLTNP